MFKEAYSFIHQSSIADKINEQGLLYIYNNQALFKEIRILNQIHDSIIIQIPTSVGWDYHAEVLTLIKMSLEQPLEFRSREFTIPLDIKMAFGTFKDEVELSNLLPETLESAHNTLLSKVSNG